MDERRSFLSQFDAVQGGYQLLRKLSAVSSSCFQSVSKDIHTLSTESLKRKSTSRTGCSEAPTVNALLLNEQQQPADQTFCNAENVETGNVPQPPPLCYVQVVVEGKSQSVRVESGCSFEALIGQVESALGGEIHLHSLKSLVRAIETQCAIRTGCSNDPATPAKPTPLRATNRDHSKENRRDFQQAIIIRNRRRMPLAFNERTINQDIDMFCITHKLAQSFKRLILKALRKGDRAITLD